MSTSGDPVCEAQTTSGLPDWVTDPNAVLDDDATWRYGRAPDYSQTRKMFEESEWVHASVRDVVSNVDSQNDESRDWKLSFYCGEPGEELGD